MKRKIPIASLSLLLSFPLTTPSAPILIGIAELQGTDDKSRLEDILENQIDRSNILGGMGSAFTYAGHNRFIAMPDRGPNATNWSSKLDNTTSFISRFHEIEMKIQPSSKGSNLPLTVTPTLLQTTLLWSEDPLQYGEVTPNANTPVKYYFSGRSDNFSPSNSMDFRHGRLDPEGISLSKDLKSVYVSDEYGPHIYRFNRESGKREQSFKLPDEFGAKKLSARGDEENQGNSEGRTANRGIEGLTITPDGKYLVGFFQGALIQDGGDGSRTNRIIRLEIASGAVEQFVYDSEVEDPNKASARKVYGSCDILAINNHEFLILERDGKGHGDGSAAKFKQIFKIDLEGAREISALNLSGEENLLPYATPKSQFLDIRKTLNDAGIKDTEIPAKLEGATFGEDVKVNGNTLHTLWVSSDNDFQPDLAGNNLFFVFGFTDSDLGKSQSGKPTRIEPRRF